MKAEFYDDTVCHQPDGCEGSKTLTEEERRAPAECFVCSVIMCDHCAAGAMYIPESVMGQSVNPRPDKYYEGSLCSTHFNEEWVTGKVLVKVTLGFVTQEYNTATKQWEGQHFTAGDDVQWENRLTSDPCDNPKEDPYLPFEMIQPGQEPKL